MSPTELKLYDKNLTNTFLPVFLYLEALTYENDLNFELNIVYPNDDLHHSTLQFKDERISKDYIDDLTPDEFWSYIFEKDITVSRRLELIWT